LAVLGVAVPVGAEEDMAAMLMEREKELWKGWAEGDGTPFAAHLAENTINLTPGGMTVGKAQLIADITSGACEVRSWELGSPTLHRVTDDVMVITYEATQDASCGGATIPAKAHVASMWVQQDGEWKAMGYFESPAAE
jgi:hypothetical protein